MWNRIKSIWSGPKVEEVSSLELEKLLKRKNTQLIDVRSPAEFAMGHIPGAKLINIADPKFKEKIERLDKSKTYYLNCRSGARSRKACKKMMNMGFENVYNLRGGISIWHGKVKQSNLQQVQSPYQRN